MNNVMCLRMEMRVKRCGMSEGAVSERERIRQLLKQIPPHDNDERYCTDLSDQEKRELRLFRATRQSKYLGQGVIIELSSHLLDGTRCHQCRQSLCEGEGLQKVVRATRTLSVELWHVNCFICWTCRELLVDLIYFYKENKIYCGRHHAETIRPRCHQCDELIFSEECTEAEGRFWHTRHFICSDCSVPLGGGRYVMKESKPFCYSCYTSLHSKPRNVCSNTIRMDKDQLVYNTGLRYLEDPPFCCRLCCQKFYSNQSFISDRGKIFCSKSCFTKYNDFIVHVSDVPTQRYERLSRTDAADVDSCYDVSSVATSRSIHDTGDS